MTSSDLRDRSARPCSPSAQRSASARLLLPDPLGPTTALIPPPNSTFVRSANDLKPCSRRARSRGGAGRSGAVRSVAVHAPTASGRAVARRSLDRLRRGRRLGDPARRTLADRRATSPSTLTSIAEHLLVVRTGHFDEPVGRAGRRLLLCVLLEPALRALEREDRRSPAPAPARRAPRASRGRRRTRGRGRARRRAPRTTRRGGTGDVGRCAATRPRRAAGPSRGRSGRRDGPGPSSTRSPRGAPTGRLRRRRDGACRAPRR